jgi:DNA-directed RNA polymerase alpha subunit
MDGGMGLSPEQQWAQLTGMSQNAEGYNMLVDDLDLPTYVHSVLSRAGIERVSDLLGQTNKQLMGVPGLGQKSLEEIRARLTEKGWTLSGESDEVPAEEDGEVLLGTGDAFEGEPEAALLGGDQSESDPSSAV